MNLQQTKTYAINELHTAKTTDEVEYIRKKYLGRDSDLIRQHKLLGSLEYDQRIEQGNEFIVIRSEIQSAIDKKRNDILTAKLSLLCQI